MDVKILRMTPNSSSSGLTGCYYNGKSLCRGSQGRCYYINSNDNKTYVDESPMRLLKTYFIYLLFLFFVVVAKKNNTKQKFFSDSGLKLIIDKDKQIVEQLKKEDCVEVIRCLSVKQ